MRVLCACSKVAIPQLSQAYNSSHLMRSAFEICRNTRLVYVALDYQKNSGNMQHTQQSVAVSFTFFISLLRSVYVSVAFIRLCSVEMNSRFANWAVSLSALSCLCWMTVGVFVCVCVCQGSIDISPWAARFCTYVGIFQYQKCRLSIAPLSVCLSWASFIYSTIVDENVKGASAKRTRHSFS